jgi:hypothetical protein
VFYNLALVFGTEALILNNYIHPGANPTIVNYNASAAKHTYNSSLVFAFLDRKSNHLKTLYTTTVPVL